MHIHVGTLYDIIINIICLLNIYIFVYISIYIYIYNTVVVLYIISTVQFILLYLKNVTINIKQCEPHDKTT